MGGRERDRLKTERRLAAARAAPSSSLATTISLTSLALTASTETGASSATPGLAGRPALLAVGGTVNPVARLLALGGTDDIARVMDAESPLWHPARNGKQFEGTAAILPVPLLVKILLKLHIVGGGRDGRHVASGTNGLNQEVGLGGKLLERLVSVGRGGEVGATMRGHLTDEKAAKELAVHGVRDQPFHVPEERRRCSLPKSADGEELVVPLALGAGVGLPQRRDNGLVLVVVGGKLHNVTHLRERLDVEGEDNLVVLRLVCCLVSWKPPSSLTNQRSTSFVQIAGGMNLGDETVVAAAAGWAAATAAAEAWPACKVCMSWARPSIVRGELLRQEQHRPDSPYGTLIKQYMSRGEIVPSKITCSLLELSIQTSRHSNWLFDGFPRNQDNLDGWLETMANKFNVPFVLFFDCDKATCIKRCLNRGEAGSGRMDDKPECMEKRWETHSKRRQTSTSRVTFIIVRFRKTCVLSGLRKEKPLILAENFLTKSDKI
eukprot:snap_masked-scaffold784_size97500-processed-gene-0.24 protein:Tk03001 transcript:snap_masked-scaffold784_size97500-processed-gene-0.24-mRNA-1 annotation:"ump-cmp kinase"